jgi:hypothetical protein
VETLLKMETSFLNGNAARSSYNKDDRLCARTRPLFPIAPLKGHCVGDSSRLFCADTMQSNAFPCSLCLGHVLDDPLQHPLTHKYPSLHRHDTNTSFRWIPVRIPTSCLNARSPFKVILYYLLICRCWNRVRERRGVETSDEKRIRVAEDRVECCYISINDIVKRGH